MYIKLEYNVHNAFTRLPRVLRESKLDCDFEIFSANADNVFSKEAGELSSRYEKYPVSQRAVCTCENEASLTFQGQSETMSKVKIESLW